MSKDIGKGLHTDLLGKNIPGAETFEEEVSVFLKNTHSTSKPFVNQDETFMKLLRVLATDLPYALMLGDPGIGKSLIVDYISSVLVGEKSLDEVAKSYPRAVKPLEQILEKSKHFENRDYAFFPNFQDPNTPFSISYTDPLKTQVDRLQADKFCYSLKRYMSDYATNNRKNICTTLDATDFSKWVTSATSGFFKQIYKTFDERADFNTFDNNDAIIKVNLSYGKSLKKEGRLKVNVDFLVPDGGKLDLNDLKKVSHLHKDFKNPSARVVKEGLRRYIPKKVRKHVVHFLQDLSTTDVIGKDGSLWTEEKKHKYAMKTLKEMSSDLNDSIQKEFEASNILTHLDVVRLIEDKYFQMNRPGRLSEASVDS